MYKWMIVALCALQTWILQAEEATVVCVHGFLSSSLSMRPVTKVLKGDGFRVFNWNYHSRQCTLEEHACQLVSHLQQIAYCYPKEPIHFATHSIGAIIVRAALNMPGCPKEAIMGRAALIAPPNQGSAFARRFRNFGPALWLAGSKSGWELMNYGPCDIQAFGPFPEEMQVLVIAGTEGDPHWFDEPNDGFLTLDETVLETPYYWTSFPVKHGALLTYSPALCCLRSFFYWGFPEEPVEEVATEVAPTDE